MESEEALQNLIEASFNYITDCDSKDSEETRLAVETLYAVKKVCLDNELSAPSWWCRTRNSFQWLNDDGTLIHKHHLGAF